MSLTAQQLDPWMMTSFVTELIGDEIAMIVGLTRALVYCATLTQSLIPLVLCAILAFKTLLAEVLYAAFEPENRTTTRFSWHNTYSETTVEVGVNDIVKDEHNVPKFLPKISIRAPIAETEIK